MIGRRKFIAGFGSATAWPGVAWAQQPDRMRRIGVLMPTDENDPVFKPRLSAFTQALANLGWTDGRNVRMDVRWYGDDNSRIRALAQELVRLQPDIIVPNGTAAIAAVQRETRTIPIVMANVADPVSSGFVAGLKQPTMWCSASCAATSMARWSRSPGQMLDFKFQVLGEEFAHKDRLSSRVASTGKRPTNSGIRPYFKRSSGSTSRKTWPALRSSGAATLAPKPMEVERLRAEMIFSRPVKR